MIVDRLDQWEKYSAIAAGLRAGFEFLARQSGPLEPGRIEIDGQRLFALVASDQGRGHDGAVLESHRKYWDIQYVAAGQEVIGWSPLEDCSQVSQPYDASRDIAFYADRPQMWLSLQQGSFAVFMPQDAHAPLAGNGPVSKIVVKVLADGPMSSG